MLGVGERKIDEFIDTLKAKEAAQAEITRLEKAKLASIEVVVVEEDCDNECPKGHVGLVDELSNLDEISQMIPMPRLVEEMIGPRGDCPEIHVVQVEQMTDEGVSTQVVPLPAVGKGKT